VSPRVSTDGRHHDPRVTTVHLNRSNGRERRRPPRARDGLL